MEACCDVAVLAILPEEDGEAPGWGGEGSEEEGSSCSSGSEEEEEEDDDDDEEDQLDMDDVGREEDEDPLFPTGGGGGKSRSSSRRRRRRGAGGARGAGQQARGRRGGPPPALVVTACDHDAALRWWELTPGRDAAVCTAVVPAFADSSPSRSSGSSGGGGGGGAVGTLSLAQAGGVLLSAHLDGSLVVWHVGQRRPVARFGPLPLLESIALTPRALGLLCCFERHILLARGAFPRVVFGWGGVSGFRGLKALAPTTE